MKKIIILWILCISYLTADFTRDMGTKIVKDNDTCLEWSDHEIVVRKFSDAISYCENLVLAPYGDWRLPNHNELLTIMDISKVLPAASISTTFEKVRKDAYWSSTSYDLNTSKAWAINFEAGDTHERDKLDGGVTVRCVRGPTP